MSNEKTTKARCQGKTADGTPCGMRPTASGYCFNHDPARTMDRTQARKRRGESRHTPHPGNSEIIPSEIRTIQDGAQILRYALEEALVLENGIQRGRLLVAIATAYIDTIKIGEIETQLKELLAVLQAREGKA